MYFSKVFWIWGKFNYIYELCLIQNILKIHVDESSTIVNILCDTFSTNYLISHSWLSFPWTKVRFLSSFLRKFKEKRFKPNFRINYQSQLLFPGRFTQGLLGVLDLLHHYFNLHVCPSLLATCIGHTLALHQINSSDAS